MVGMVFLMIFAKVGGCCPFLVFLNALRNQGSSSQRQNNRVLGCWRGPDGWITLKVTRRRCSDRCSGGGQGLEPKLRYVRATRQNVGPIVLQSRSVPVVGGVRVTVKGQYKFLLGFVMPVPVVETRAVVVPRSQSAGCRNGSSFSCPRRTASVAFAGFSMYDGYRMVGRSVSKCRGR